MRSAALTRVLACLALAVWATVGVPVQAGEAPVDAGLLEFLGSVDSDDQAWHAWLAASGTAPTGYCPQQPCAPPSAAAAPADPSHPPGAAPPANPSPSNPPPTAAPGASDGPSP